MDKNAKNHIYEFRATLSDRSHGTHARLAALAARFFFQTAIIIFIFEAFSSFLSFSIHLVVYV